MSKVSSFFRRYHFGSLITASVGVVGVLQSNQQIISTINPKAGSYVAAGALILAAFQEAALTVKGAGKK